MSTDDERESTDERYDIGAKLRDLADLAKFFRAHPRMPWGEFVALAMEGGFSEGEADLVWWSSGVETINRVEEEELHKQAQRN